MTFPKLYLAAISLPLMMISARAQTPGILVWANNASPGSPHLQAFDMSTGAAAADFPAPNPDAQKGKANGRGIAVVDTKIYYSLANTRKRVCDRHSYPRRRGRGL